MIRPLACSNSVRPAKFPLPAYVPDEPDRPGIPRPFYPPMLGQNLDIEA